MEFLIPLKIGQPKKGRPIRDLTGMTFGRWTAESPFQSPKTRHTYWRCRCACGVTRCVQAVCLLNEDPAHASRSCGCLRRETARSTMSRLRASGRKTGKENWDTIRAAQSPTLADIAWSAGFIEGEGCFSSHNTCTVSVAQVQREPLERLQRFFGGSISARLGKGRKHGLNVWRVSGARARGVAYTLYQMMSPRRRRQIRAGIYSRRIENGLMV